MTAVDAPLQHEGGVTMSTTTEDDVETYEFESAVNTDQRHQIARVGNGPWGINPVQVAQDRDLRIDEVRTLIRELRMLVREADRLAKFRRSCGPVDDAIREEVEALIGDRGWDKNEAAQRFGMTAAKLTHRLGGHSSWTITDITHIAAAVTDGPEESAAMRLRLMSIAWEVTL